MMITYAHWTAVTMAILFPPIGIPMLTGILIWDGFRIAGHIFMRWVVAKNVELNRKAAAEAAVATSEAERTPVLGDSGPLRQVA